MLSEIEVRRCYASVQFPVLLDIDRLHLVSVDTNDMAAAAGRKDEYETYNRQFCLRLVEYLMIMIKFQVRQI